MKISLIFLALSLGLSLEMTSAHAGDEAFIKAPPVDLDTIQNKANHLNAEEQAALDQLNSARDNQANADTNAAAQNLLTKSFSALFVQADNIQLPIQTAEPIFGDSRRDLYTFCPTDQM